MTNEEALIIVDKAASLAHLSRADHANVLGALAHLKKSLDNIPASEEFEIIPGDKKE